MALFAAASVSAQTPAKKPPAAHPGSAAHHPAKPSPSKPAKPAPPPAPAWPINERPKLASVTLNSSGLRIEAHNSSLKQILHDVSMITGAKVEGDTKDQRVFGTYGPGRASDVLEHLLNGSGYNVMLVGDQGQGAPRRIVLTPRSTAPPTQASYTPPQPYRPQAVEPPAPPQNPQPRINPVVPPNVRPPFRPNQPNRAPQQLLQEMRERQQRLQQQLQQH